MSSDLNTYFESYYSDAQQKLKSIFNSNFRTSGIAPQKQGNISPADIMRGRRGMDSGTTINARGDKRPMAKGYNWYALLAIPVVLVLFKKLRIVK